MRRPPSRRPDPLRRRLRLAVPAGALSLVLLAGCGSDSGSSGATNADAVSITGIIDAPVPDQAVPYADVAVHDSSTLQSFRMAGSDPEQTIRDYVALAGGEGWAVADPAAAADPAAGPASDWSATMTKGDQTLTATAAQATGEENVTELSLEVTTP